MPRGHCLLVALSAWMVFSSCSFSGDQGLDQDYQPRTYYESLDLSSPESAVTTFTDAFARDDFLTVYLVLSSRSQFIFSQRLRLFDYSHIIQPNSFERIQDDVPLFAEGLGAGEHADESWYIFDQIMLAAKRHDALLIDLSGGVTILDSETIVFLDYDEALEVIAEVEGIQGEVIFRMIRAPSGKWRVYQVIVPDGDEGMVPWAVPDLAN